MVEFQMDTDPEVRRMRIEDEPDLAPNPVVNALLGAAGEHLAFRWGLGGPPAWTMRPERFLETPLVTNPEIPESERFGITPPAFRNRRIFPAIPLCIPLGPVTLSVALQPTGSSERWAVCRDWCAERRALRVFELTPVYGQHPLVVNVQERTLEPIKLQGTAAQSAIVIGTDSGNSFDHCVGWLGRDRHYPEVP